MKILLKWLGVGVACAWLGGPARAGVVDDFNTDHGNTAPNFNGIDGALWTQSGGTGWQRSSSHAESNNGGDAGVGTLQSVPIAVGADDLLAVDVGVSGWANPGQAVKVWGADAGGIVSAAPIGWLDFTSGGSRTMTTDARGYSHVVLQAIDTYAGGFGWYGIDNVQLNSHSARWHFANDSFEDGFTGWTTSGTAWGVVAENGAFAAEGGRFAATKANESFVGNLTSPAITVTRRYLTFAANGWGGSGSSLNEAGDNYFLLLDGTQTPVARLNNNSGDAWSTLQFDLAALGFHASDTVYLRAVDGRNGGFAWMGLDYVRQVGISISLTPQVSMSSSGADPVPDVYDQSNLAGAGSVDANGQYTDWGPLLGQSFTTPAGGPFRVDSISVKLGTAINSPSGWQIRVSALEGGSRVLAQYATTNDQSLATPAGNAWVTFIFTDGPTLSPNTLYAFDVFTAGGAATIQKSYSTDAYASGTWVRIGSTARQFGAGYSVPNASEDLLFHVGLSEVVVDSTPPAWVSGWPKADTVNAGGFTVRGEIDEAGTVYYVVVANNATAPSAAQVKAGHDATDSAALKSGDFAVLANAEGSEAVTGLAAATDYDVYVVAQDAVPNLQGSATKVDVATAAPDSTPPGWVSGWPKADTATLDGFTVRGELDEAGTVYYVVVTNNAAAPTASEVLAGQASGGGAALKNGSVAVAANVEGTAAVTGLSENTDYDVYVAAKDSVLNPQVLATKKDVKTAAGPVTIEDFAGGSMSATKWYFSSGLDAVGLVTGAGLPGGLYGMKTQSGACTKYYLGGGDGSASVSWGPFFTVNDTAQTISLKIAGGNYTELNPTDLRAGATGIALWDVANAAVVPATLLTASQVNDFGLAVTISLNSAGIVAGNRYGIVVIDRNTGSWGWTGVANIWASAGGVTLSANPHHTVYTQYDWDTAADFAGWTITGTMAIKGNGTQRYVDTHGAFTADRGYLTSKPSGDGTTGSAQSPTFTVQGDIIEFRISGGALGDNVAFQLLNAADDTVLRQSAGGQKDEFQYAYWDVHALKGSDVYLKVIDNNTGGWGQIEVDSIREVAFDAVGDVTPPGWISGWPKADTITSVGCTVRAKTDEAGAAYYVVVADGATAPSSSQVRTGHDATDSAALKSGTITLPTPGTEGNSTVIGLSSTTAYDVYVVAEDEVPLLQAGPTKLEFTTGNPPMTIEDFASGTIDGAKWYLSSGVDAVGLVTGAGLPGGQYGMKTQSGAASKYYQGGDDGRASVSWGPFFTANDTSKSISLQIAGGNATDLNPADLRGGATGVALWDVTNGTVVAATLTTASQVNDFGAAVAMSLSSAGIVSGGRYGVIVIDRNTFGWGWTGVANITAPSGSVTLSAAPHHTVYRQYDWDTAGDFAGWAVTGTVGIKGQGTTRYIDLNGAFAADRGYLTSKPVNDTSTGSAQSPTFTIQGDIIEFRINGGALGDSVAFQLIKSADDSVLAQTGGGGQNEFLYTYWSVRAWKGTPVFLKLVDSSATAAIEVDAIREVGFDAADTTPPSWVSGWPGADTPTVSGCTVRGKIDENGTAYFVVVDNNAGAPTAAQVMAGHDAANGAARAAGNVALTAYTEGTVPASGLSAGTDYDVYIVAADATGNPQANPVKIDIATAAAPDTTPPVWSSGWPKADTTTVSGFTVRAAINEAGTAFYVVVPDGAAAPTADNVKAAQAFGGAAALASGTLSLPTADSERSDVVGGRDPSTAYDVYFVAQDGSLNLQDTPRKVDVQTPGTPLPIEDFAGGTLSSTRWYISSDVDAVGLVIGAGLPGGQYGLKTQSGAGTKYKDGGGDGMESVAWGPFFTVNDTSQSISLQVAGGNATDLSPVDLRQGATGVALWDVANATVVPGTLTYAERLDNFGSPVSISLASAGIVAGGRYGIVVIDRNTFGFGWTGVANITVPGGSVTLSAQPHHTIYRQYDWDTAGDFAGWTVTGTMAVKGNSTTRYIDLNAAFTADRGYLTSKPVDDTTTGSAQSPTFTIQGDIIEFRISGGALGDGVGFQLIKASDASVLRQSAGGEMNEFQYDYWDVHALKGTSVYLKVFDNSAGFFGQIELDAIREVAFDGSAERYPGTVFMIK